MKKLKLSTGNKISFLNLESDSVNAPTIVFAHGFPLDHSMWKEQHSLRSAANLIIPDLPGFGASDLVGDLSMKLIADQIARLLDELDVGRVIFCGLSMGGYIGWEFASRHADRLLGLISCNTRATADDPTTARARRVAASQVLKTGPAAVAEVMRCKLFSATTLERNPGIVQSVVDTIGRTSPETIAAAQLAMSQRADHSASLSAIACPVLVIAGSDDSITPSAEMKAMSEQIPASTFVEIAASGHLSPIENASTFNAAVASWLTEQGL